MSELSAASRALARAARAIDDGMANRAWSDALPRRESDALRAGLRDALPVVEQVAGDHQVGVVRGWSANTPERVGIDQAGRIRVAIAQAGAALAAARHVGGIEAYARAMTSGPDDAIAGVVARTLADDVAHLGTITLERATTAREGRGGILGRIFRPPATEPDQLATPARIIEELAGYAGVGGPPPGTSEWFSRNSRLRGLSVAVARSPDAAREARAAIAELTAGARAIAAGSRPPARAAVDHQAAWLGSTSMRLRGHSARVDAITGRHLELVRSAPADPARAGSIAAAALEDLHVLLSGGFWTDLARAGSDASGQPTAAATTRSLPSPAAARQLRELGDALGVLAPRLAMLSEEAVLPLRELVHLLRDPTPGGAYLPATHELAARSSRALRAALATADPGARAAADIQQARLLLDSAVPDRLARLGDLLATTSHPTAVSSAMAPLAAADPGLLAVPVQAGGTAMVRQVASEAVTLARLLDIPLGAFQPARGGMPAPSPGELRAALLQALQERLLVLGSRAPGGDRLLEASRTLGRHLGPGAEATVPAAATQVLSSARAAVEQVIAGPGTARGSGLSAVRYDAMRVLAAAEDSAAGVARGSAHLDPSGLARLAAGIDDAVHSVVESHSATPAASASIAAVRRRAADVLAVLVAQHAGRLPDQQLAPLARRVLELHPGGTMAGPGPDAHVAGMVAGLLGDVPAPRVAGAIAELRGGALRDARASLVAAIDDWAGADAGRLPTLLRTAATQLESAGELELARGLERAAARAGETGLSDLAAADADAIVRWLDAGASPAAAPRPGGGRFGIEVDAAIAEFDHAIGIFGNTHHGTHREPLRVLADQAWHRIRRLEEIAASSGAAASLGIGDDLARVRSTLVSDVVTHPTPHVDYGVLGHLRSELDVIRSLAASVDDAHGFRGMPSWRS